MPDDPELNNWHRALSAQGLDVETVRLVILLVREHYEQTGSWPTATQLRASLKGRS